MKTYTVTAATFENGHFTTVNDVTIPAAKFKVDGFGEHSDLAEHLADIVGESFSTECMMKQMLDSCVSGECSMEEREDLTDSEAVKGTKTFLFYLMPPCAYDDDFAADCKATENFKTDGCTCDGDVLVLTLIPN